MSRRQSYLVPVAALCVAAGPADYELLMQQKSDGRVFDEKPWVEMEALLPRPPEPSGLVTIDVGPVSNNKFEIDEM